MRPGKDASATGGKPAEVIAGRASVPGVQDSSVYYSPWGHR